MMSPAEAPELAGWRFDNSYLRLPDSLFTRILPEAVEKPELIALNSALCADLGLDAARLTRHADIFAGNRTPQGADPIAQAYCGHQYGNFVVLGDGRAHLLGEHLAPDSRRLDIQLKGSGRTPYSRRGDGRAVLGPMLREYLISEAMHAFGLPTTRSLAVAATGETVWRETAKPGAVLTRVAASHIRVGTFQHAAIVAGREALVALLDYTIARHAPECADTPIPALAFLEEVMRRQCSLVAGWMHVGFVHGVMNTDNMAISGETIDYGPCAFLDEFHINTVFSSIDAHGRYAYGNQPQIALWNLTRLAESLLPLIDPEQEKAVHLARQTLDGFGEIFRTGWTRGMRGKLGLFNAEPEDDSLATDLLSAMQADAADFTNTFRALDPATPPATPALAAWHPRWTARLTRQSQHPAESAALRHSRNPAIIPRNHRIEQALAAAERGDLRPFHRLAAVLARPFDDHPEAPDLQTPPAPEERVAATFCGT